MNCQYRFHIVVERLFNKRRIKIQRTLIRLDKHRLKSAVSHGEHRRDIGIRRNNHSVARTKSSEFHIGAEYKPHGIEAVTYADGI